MRTLVEAKTRRNWVTTGDSEHGGLNRWRAHVPAIPVGKWINRQAIEHHGIKVGLKQGRGGRNSSWWRWGTASRARWPWRSGATEMASVAMLGEERQGMAWPRARTREGTVTATATPWTEREEKRDTACYCSSFFQFIKLLSNLL